MYELGHTYVAMGYTNEAVSIWTNLHSIAQEKPGLSSSIVRKTMGYLADIHEKQGEHRAAENLLVKVSEWEARALPPDVRESLLTRNHLASNYYDQERFTEAQRLQVDLMKECQENLRHGDSLTMTVMANLASTLTELGKMEEAYNYHTCALELRTQVCGSDHEDTISSLAQLVLHHRRAGQLSDAEKLQIQVFKTRQGCLEKDDPQILIAMACLACIYSDQGRMAKAKKLERPILETYRALYGANHNKTLEAEANLAYTVSYNPDRLSEAKALQVDVLERLEKAVPPDSPSIVTAMGQLGMTYLEQGRSHQAIVMFEKEVTGVSKKGGDLGHNFHIHALGHPASCHKARGYASEAETLEKLIARMKEEELASYDNDEKNFDTEGF